MPELLTIRFAAREDSSLISYFIERIAEYENMTDEVEGDPKTVERVLFDEHQAEAILAFEGETPVGFAVFFHNFSTFKCRRGLYLEDLFVEPDHRGKGYGKALLLYLVRLAKERGCGRMEWCCLNWNTPSINFYRSLGAVSMDEWRTYRLDTDTIDKLCREN